MPLSSRFRLLALIDRLSRLRAAEEWAGELNPTQAVALGYLARANRFSRAPSHVADFLATTRGSVSQTLRALAKKGLIVETRSSTDRRSLSYDVTPAGLATLERLTTFEAAANDIGNDDAEAAADALAALLRGVLARRGGRSFGICHTCRHHGSRLSGAWCLLLDVPLAPEETGRICREHEPSSEAA